MVGNHHFTRVDTHELKDFIYRKIGHQRAHKYFDCLKRFLALKLTKPDFDKSCIRTIGRENIPLHNRLIRSILQNACEAKIPPQKARKVSNGYSKNPLQSLYGDSFPKSHRKCRSLVKRDRKFRDRPSPLGPLGKSSSITYEETITRIQEQQSDQTELHSLCSRLPMVEDGEEVEQSPIVRRWDSVTAPIGVSLNKGGARKASYYGFRLCNLEETCENRGELPDSRTLMSRLEKKLGLEGVGISMDCANLFNNSLDLFMKRLIEPCLGLAGSRCKNPRSIIGRRSSNQLMSGYNETLSERLGQPKYASMLDFRVAMESNPRKLGQDCSIQLEKMREC
ncbi:hypothetical protein ACJIZ3_001268 [Penstemon smallii]|uniref:Uncharacterized protein n=1 Tax=Penstemon smallii TaxID=265156 RepID=A0ABD3U5Z1_9LAMI